MIRIHRPPRGPLVLRREGAAKRAQHEAEYVADSAGFQNGTKTFDFDRDVYAHPSVKRTLLRMQHAKCAFCEARPLHVSDGDVEHYRPKAAVRQGETDPLQRPGYYWLAYDWENLLFACERCNRRHKKSQFPLHDAAVRARRHTDDVSREQPLFVDPAREDPALLIGFRGHVPFARGGDVRARATLKALGLRRFHLNRDREEHLEMLWAVYAIATLPAAPAAERRRAEDLLRRMTAPEAEYSLMSRTAVDRWHAGAPAPAPKKRGRR